MSDLSLIESNSEEEKSNKLFVFQSGDVLFALPLSSVFEIRQDLELIDLPWKNNGIIGAIEYRGLLIPVIHPSEMVELEKKKVNNYSLILCEYDSIKVAFQNDRFYKIITDESEADDQELDTDQNKFISGISILDNKSLILLNTIEICKFFKNRIKKQIVSKKKIKEQNQDLEKVSEKDSTKSICFLIDKIQFVVPINEVLEVLENQSVTPLFKVNQSLRGLINLRGRVVPCIDISSYLNLNQRNLNEHTQFVLLGYENFEIALCVDAVNKMKVFPNSGLQTNTDSLPASIREYTKGIFKANRQTLLMLSTKNLILSKELQPYWHQE
jgi:purine-binding chemotaxis protein CheW